MRILILLLASALASSSSCKKDSSGPAGSGVSGSAIAAGPIAQAPVTHGITIGDVGAESVILWARSDRPATLHVQLTGPADASHSAQVAVTADHDFAGSATVHGLRADTEYRYEVWFQTDKPAQNQSPGAGQSPAAEAEGRERGSLRTAPAADQARPVRLIWGGDLAGQNVCRDSQRGFTIFEHMPAGEFDLFIALGDMIYADNACEALGKYGNRQIPGPGRAVELSQFWAKWKYARGDARFRDFLAKVPTFAIWDDHEVVNDFGPTRDTRTEAPYRPGMHLLPNGLRSFLDYNPIARDSQDPRRMYRSARWGKHLELFFLDNRQYRDANDARDTDDKPKTMLGASQRAWLERALAESDATWKVVVSSVPMSIPTGNPDGPERDGWANFKDDTGFERELLGILRAAQKAGVNRSIWITTDVHFATGFRYRPFADAPDFQVHEFVTGPLNAGLFPSRDFDQTLGAEPLFFHGPETPESVTEYQNALGWMNFGTLSIDKGGTLRVQVINGRGETVYEIALPPT